MAAGAGISGDVASWTNNAALISSASEPVRWTMDMDSSPVETTVFGSSTGTSIGSLRSATGLITSRISAAATGAGGDVTWASSLAYAIRVQQWALTISARVHDVTEMDDSSEPEWRSFVPGLVNWSGTYEGMLDDTTAITQPTIASDTTSAANITLTVDGSNSFVGSGFIGQISAAVDPTTLNSVTHNFVGAGELTKNGTTFIAAGTVGSLSGEVGFSTGALTLQAFSGKTFVGNAFPTSITVTVPYQDIITVETAFTFTGAVTIS